MGDEYFSRIEPAMTFESRAKLLKEAFYGMKEQCIAVSITNDEANKILERLLVAAGKVKITATEDEAEAINRKHFYSDNQAGMF